MYRLIAIPIVCFVFSISALATEEAEDVDDVDIQFQLSGPVHSSSAPGLEDIPPEVLDKLSAEQIADILQAREDSRIALAGIDSAVAELVPILVPFGFFLSILLGLTATLVARYRKHGQLHQTLRLMIEKGADIPPELIAPAAAPYSDLRRGLILIGAGAALLILVGLVFGFETGSWAVGLIPTFIGAGYLIIWRISRRSESS